MKVIESNAPGQLRNKPDEMSSLMFDPVVIGAVVESILWHIAATACGICAQAHVHKNL